MSIIYSAGAGATARAAIEAVVRSTYLKTADDGSMYIDEAGLRAWLRAQFDSIATTDPAANPVLADMAARAVDVSEFVDPLARIVGPANWKGTPGWPATASTGDQATVLSGKMNDLKAASQRLSDYFARMMDADFLLVATKGSLADAGLAWPPVKTRAVESRVYQQTFVTDWNEESAPSEPSVMIDIDQDDSVNVVLAAPVAGRNIEKWRLYRSNSGNSGAAFQFVAEGLVGQFAYSDKIKSADLDEVCPTTTWAEPPAKLRGLTGMANGMMAGFFDNTVAVCESYFGYAWPAKYQVTTEHPVVGLASFDQTLFVGTQGHPYFISGADAASMSAQKLNSSQSCVSARSIVGIQGGALYASPDGICLASLSGISVITAKHFTREDWQALNPASIFAVEHEQVYYFFWQSGTRRGCYGLHLTSGKLVAMDFAATAAFVDRAADVMYVADGSSIRAVFSSATRKSATWMGKLIKLPSYVGFAWLQVDSDFSAPVTVRVYGDGQLRYAIAVNSINPVRVPAGRFLEVQLEVISQARVTRVQLASSTAELKAV